MQNPAYRVASAVVILLCACAYANDARAAAPPCPSDRYIDDLSVNAPSRLAYGRTGVVSLYAYGSIAAVRIQQRQRLTGQLLYERVLTEEEARRLSGDDSTGMDLAILTASPGVGALTVEVSYDATYMDYNTGQNSVCRQTETAVVEAVDGARPRFEVIPFVGKVRDDVRFQVRPTRSCAEGLPGKVSFVLRARRRTVFSASDICPDYGVLRRRGPKLPNVEVRDANRERTAAMVIGLRGKHTFARRYRFHVLVGSTVIARRWLLVRQRYHKAYRVWEGTDSFINYCINQGRPIYSSNLRLYCVSPGYASRTIRVSKRKLTLPDRAQAHAVKRFATTSETRVGA
jgi:hypothetical protein